jgi:predicted kinase
MTRPLIHIVTGSTGAGKTTYARQLAAELGAIRFSIDEWMNALFWPDRSDPIDPAWAMERVERCYTQIWSVARDAARQGLPSVLDLGFTTHNSRCRFVDLAREAGFQSQLHWIDVPADERWRRVEQRNQRPSEQQLEFAVTREMFDYVESLWEPPEPAEMADVNGLRVGGAS